MLIVGGGKVASQRIKSILHTDTLITVITSAHSISLHSKGQDNIPPVEKG